MRNKAYVFSLLVCVGLAAHSTAAESTNQLPKTATVPAIRDWKDIPFPQQTMKDLVFSPALLERRLKEDKQAMDILNIAKPLYDQVRETLKTRFHPSDSRLDYPVSDRTKGQWTLVRFEDSFLVHVQCSDMMYSAHFVMEFKKNETGHWTCGTIWGKEVFKGE